MAKFNAKENDPERYARVKEEQAKLQTRCKSELRLARLCPYCDYKLSIAIKGEHSWATATTLPFSLAVKKTASGFPQFALNSHFIMRLRNTLLCFSSGT